MKKKPVAKKRAAAAPRKTRKYVRKASKERVDRLAAGVAAGVPVAELAREEGISRQHCSSLVNSSPVKHVITDLVNANLPQIEELFSLGLAAIRDAITDGNTYATEKTKNPDGTVVVASVLLGPDHYARMGAMKVLNTICCTGRAAPKPVDPRDLVPKMTYPELLRLSREQDEIERLEREQVAA